MDRVTQAQLAEAVGCSQITVSRALRNGKKVSKETRTKILQAAEKLGYRPDPMLSALANYKRPSMAKHLGCSIALVVPTIDDEDQENANSPARALELDELKAACAVFGFSVERVVLEINDPHLKSQARILRARGVQGILWATPLRGLHLPVPLFDVSEFSCLAYGANFTETPLTMINVDTLRAVLVAYRKAISAGRKRIGLCIYQEHNLREEGAHAAAYAIAKEQLARDTRILPALFFENDQSVIGDWIREHRPDALIIGAGNYHTFSRLISEAGMRVPDDCGLVCLDVIPGVHRNLTGVDFNRRQWQAAAVQTLFSMIRTAERGIPDHPYQILIEPTLVEGSTL